MSEKSSFFAELKTCGDVGKALLASDTLISDLWSIVNSDPFSHIRICQKWIERRLATCAR